MKSLHTIAAGFLFFLMQFPAFFIEITTCWYRPEKGKSTALGKFL